MLNYMRSEWYRILHTKELWTFTGICAGALLAVSVLTCICNARIADFRYGSVRFVLSMLTSGMSAIFYAGAVLASLLFPDDKKSGIMKYTVATGVSRTEIYLGKCVVCVLAALVSMGLILIAYAGSATLLLEGPVQPYLGILLRGVAANVPFAAAGVFLYLALAQFLKHDTLAMLGCLFIFIGIPWITFFAGLRWPVFAKAAEWMPYMYLRAEVRVNMGEMECLWMNGAGLSKCLIAGAAGIVIFGAVGVLLNRRQEL